MIRLPYGDGTVELSVPPDRLRVAEPPVAGDTAAPGDALRDALRAPLGSPPLEQLASGRRVAYLIDDATRSEPHQAFVEAVLPALRVARCVRAIVATGSHERMSEGNRRLLALLEQTADRHGVTLHASIHDCHDGSLNTHVGVTSRGTPVEINRHVLGADLVVITSDVKNHYFAGYSNPLKNILPGVSSFAGVERNHSFALESESTFGRHPWHPDPERRTNPVAEDMLEAAHMVLEGRDAFALATVTTPAGVAWAGAGAMREVTREAICRVDRVATVRVKPVRYLIVSPGGDPQDETLYNAQRGLELSRHAVREGGEVLFLASCHKGTAPTPEARAEFYDRLTQPLDQVMASLEQDYVLYSHKAYKFAQLIGSLRAIHVVSELPDDVIAAAHLHSASNAQTIVDQWLRQSDEAILVTTHANKVALYPTRA